MIKKKKSLSKIGRGNFVNVVKNIYRNPTANITLKDKKTKTFLLLSRTRPAIVPDKKARCNIRNNLTTTFQHHTGRLR